MSANSSLVQFLPDEDNQNLHVKMYKKYVQPGLICTEGDLKEVFEFPEEGGNLPVRAHGSRWISYKRKALQRFVDRYGAYLKHLANLTEDKSIKSTDRQRLKGYLIKWREARMLIGSALIQMHLSLFPYLV